ncbi:hypothetical protein [Hymenobacter terrenus]|uniref:hypothetical protein n=1 Tax=Hymenobacter terrenus TaxID=1629124 RepID=UPI0006196869|nr:hypothetical protein [Hymenobacter terrenus]
MRFRARGWRHEALVVAIIAGVYAIYLLTSDYQNLYYDAEDYWQLGHRFYQDGHFSLLAYDDALRGYAYPLVNFWCLALRKALDLRAVTVVKLLNAAMAGALFGVVGPRLWQASTGQPMLPSVPRRLLWAGLGFVFWRDYFNFSLSDFPALFALGLALWQAQRRSLGAALVAGLALALAINVRPIYQVAVPAVVGLLWHGPPRPAWPTRLAGLALGAALVLTPQWLINRRHFGANTPLVLSQSKELRISNLYLQKLKWGLLHEKYESSVGRELPTGQLLFMNAAGAAILRQEGLTDFRSLGQYLKVAAGHPGAVVGAYARHLFAGLDISHPTPYLHRWAPSPLRNGLNYTLWFWAGLVVIGAGRPTWRLALVLASLLLPCLAVVPLSMEVRFLLPLHLLLLALVSFGPWPTWALATGRRLAVVGLAYGLFLVGCFTLSARITQTVEPRFQAYLLPASSGKK